MILPHLEGKRISYWNTNQWAKAFRSDKVVAEVQGRATAAAHVLTFIDDIDDRALEELAKSEFLKPERKERLSEHAMRVLNADALYGGYLEDRSFLWKGSYMEPSKFLHLGVDIVAKAGSAVHIDVDAELMQIYDDTPEEHGWGTRLLFRIEDPYSNQEWPGEYTYLVFGHLAPIRWPYHQIGKKYKAGDQIGFLGTPEQNGGWSSHLHVQAIRGIIDEFIVNPALLDGYGELSELGPLSRRYPDPTRFFKWMK